MFLSARLFANCCIAAVLAIPFAASAQEQILPPTIEFVGNRSVEVAQTLGINVYAYSQSEQIPWLWVESLPDGAEFFDRGEGFRTFLWYPGPAQVGQHTIRFIAADANDQQIRTEMDVVINVTPGTFESQAFSIVAPDHVDAFVGEMLSVRILATDSNGTVPALTAEWLPEGANLDDNGDGSRSLTWIPTSEQLGTYTVRLVAVSANFPNISTNHDIRISVIGRAPLISFPVSPGVEAGEVMSFPVKVTKPSGAVPSLIIDRLPARASFDDNGDGSRQFTWITAESDTGTHSFTLTAEDPITGLGSSVTLYVNILSDSSEVLTDRTISLSSELLSLELNGALVDGPIDVSDGSVSAYAGFLTHEVELLVNAETIHTVSLLPGVNTVALESAASTQRFVLNIYRSPFPSLVPDSLPVVFAVDIDDQAIALSPSLSPGERPVENSLDVYSLKGSAPGLEAYLGTEADFKQATSIDISDSTLVAASRQTPQAGVWIYERSDSEWEFHEHLSPDLQQYPEGFGSVVALEGDTLAVAAVYDAGSSATDLSKRGAPGAGAVLIFQRIDGEWRNTDILKAPMPEFNDYFGSSLALEGDTLVVAAIGEDSSGVGVDSDPSNNEYRRDETANLSAGAVFVYQRIDDQWVYSAYLKPGDNTKPASAFGHAVSIFEDTISVSALYAPRTAESLQANENPSLYGVGAVYMFDRSDSGWKQSAKLEPPANNWSFGLDIDLKKNQLIVLTQARAYFYERHDQEWLLLWDENVSMSTVSFNHEAMVFGAPNNKTILYRSNKAFP